MPSDMPAPADMQARYKEVERTLQKHDQAHLLAFYDELSPPEQEALLEEIEAQDWEELSELILSHVVNKPPVSIPEGLEPAPYYPLEPGDDLLEKYKRARERGEALLREGRVAAFTVAGGQGTRLGWDGPKGTFPATPVEGKPLFRVFAEGLQGTERKYGAAVPWYIMTSPINHDATVAFFEEHGFFGLEPGNVTFFSQGVMPSIGLDGKVLLADKGRLALNPDGHGGSLKALYRSGALHDMERRGVTLISYFQVDNPNVKPLDPLFLGLHDLDGAQMSSKGLAKRGPEEKVGNFCGVDGRVQVIEYSDMPAELAGAREEDGTLKFDMGSIAIHTISVDFVRSLNEGNRERFALPYHRAEKRVSYLDLSTGERVEPKESNAVKLEMFVFDALPLAETSIILETDRVEEFAPIKNAQGDDSPETSRRLQSQRAGQWLRLVGVEVPFDEEGHVSAVIELSPLTAVEPRDLEGADLPERIEPGDELAL